MNKLLKGLREPNLVVNHFKKIYYESFLGNRIPDEKFLKKIFKFNMGYELDLNNPKTFNEKLQWLKLNDRKPEYTVMVDKYKVRSYISEKLGEEYLIPLLGVWDNPNDIDFNELPNQFVLKCNHNSGLGMCICKDKNNLDIKKVKKELKKGLKQNYYLNGREWPYKDVPRKIIAEKYMIDDKVGELRDYKFFCFNGKVKCFKIDFDRFTSHKANYFDKNGCLLELGEKVCPPDYNKELELPTNLDLMINLAERLSYNIPFVRIDFYEVNNYVYFGEITFFPASGCGAFLNDKWDYKLGSYIEFPQI